MSLARVVVFCLASTHTALVSSPSLTVLHLPTQNTKISLYIDQSGGPGQVLVARVDLSTTCTACDMIGVGVRRQRVVLARGERSIRTASRKGSNDQLQLERGCAERRRVGRDLGLPSAIAPQSAFQDYTSLLPHLSLKTKSRDVCQLVLVGKWKSTRENRDFHFLLCVGDWCVSVPCTFYVIPSLHWVVSFLSLFRNNQDPSAPHTVSC